MTTQPKAPVEVTADREVAAVAATYPQIRKFSVAEYYRMGDVGILGPDERVELIEGEIIVMPPIGSRHANRVGRFIDVFARYVPDLFHIRIQNPVHLDDGSEPQPDVSLLVRREGGYEEAHPTPQDVLLLIEVADSSLEFDRQRKARLYGRAGIPEMWVKNIPEDCIERFTEPGPDGYAQHSVHRRGETLTPTLLPDVEVAVDNLLPPSATTQSR